MCKITTKTIYNKLTKDEKKWLCPDGKWSEIADDKVVYKEVSRKGFIEAYNTGIIENAVYFDIAVVKEHRQEGLASKMFNNMVECLKEKNFTTIFTYVHKDNDPSYWMLDKFGFEIIGKCDDMWKLKLQVA